MNFWTFFGDTFCSYLFNHSIFFNVVWQTCRKLSREFVFERGWFLVAISIVIDIYIDEPACGLCSRCILVHLAVFVLIIIKDRKDILHKRIKTARSI